MTQDQLVMWAKIVSMAIFFPTFLGFTLYAYWGPNKQKLQDQAALILED